MPHLKVTPFDPAVIDRLVADSEVVEFRAIRTGDGRADEVELIGIDFEGEAFALALHKRAEEWLIKSDKWTRPLDASRIKRALAFLAETAGLEVRHHNIHHAPTKPAPAESAHKQIEDFVAIDFGGRPVAIEVGFGSGRHLLHQAAAHPETLFIGIEIHTPSAQQVLKQIALQGLENVWVVDYDARLLMEMIPSNALEAVYVHFPVPWDKKPHRRVISDRFVAESLRALKPGGVLELRTDSEKYYRYALEVFSHPQRVRFDVTKNHEAVIRSKYEDRWQRMAKNIYTLRLHAEEASAPLVALTVPTFDGGPLRPVDALLEVPRESIVREDHFVHFGPRYRLSDGSGALIACAFGSFERPEHAYIAVREGSASYYPHPPVPTRAAARAHHTIGEYLYA